MPIPQEPARLRRTSARAMVFEQVRQWIERGVLAPGEIIKDLEIAARLGVSRTPVREALHSLEQLGAIETFPNHQTRVSNVSPEDVRLVYPPLAALIGLAARTAAPSTTPGLVATLTEANERMLGASKRCDGDAAREADEQFHGVLVEAAVNPYLTNAIDALRIHFRRLGSIYFSNVPPGKRSYEEHKAIIDAVRQGDPGRTGTAVQSHYERAMAELIVHVSANLTRLD